MTVAIATIDTQPLDVAQHIAAVSGPTHGAVSTFIGMVRDHDPSVEGTVTHLEYSAHPDAESIIARIADKIAAEWPVEIAVTHRIGLLAVGDAAIVAAVASAHRAEAIQACSALVEIIKAELPIWKREILADGTHTWVGIR